MNGRTSRGLALAIAAGALVAGCSDARRERLEGAQRALASMPDVEIIQRDAAAGVLTVRSRSTGAVSTIDLMSRSTRSGVAAGAASDVPPTPGAAAAAGVSGAAEAVIGGADRNTVAAGTVATPGTEAAAPGAGAGAAGDVAATDPGRTPVPLAATATVVRDPQGRVQKIEGSGFSIERSPGATRATSAARASATSSATAGERRRRSVPFVCAAGESHALQGVDFDVPGAGIVAEPGCTLALANVRIRAGGWGLVVNPGATVRIDASLVEGRTGALDLYPGASLSAWATTFRGALGRAVAAPQFIDRGGNSWE